MSVLSLQAVCCTFFDILFTALYYERGVAERLDYVMVLTSARQSLLWRVIMVLCADRARLALIFGFWLLIFFCPHYGMSLATNNSVDNFQYQNFGSSIFTP